MNALLITRLRIPPLIVTLGSFSLFRGLAEGLTGGVQNYTNFPHSFLFLGQGYLFGDMPPQLPSSHSWRSAFWVLLHRTTVGRGIGGDRLLARGARYAGLPVGRLVGLVYVLSGLVPAWRRSFTSRTWDRRRPTPARATSCWRSPRWCWAERRSSAAGEASSGRSWVCSRSACLQTACGWPTCRPSLREC